MKIVNRGYLIVRPKRPFLEWARSIDQEDVFLDDEYMEPNVYLIDEDFFDLEPVIESSFKRILQTECSMLTDLEEEWPDKITIELFHEWFEVEIGSAVMDLERSDLRTENI